MSLTRRSIVLTGLPVGIVSRLKGGEGKLEKKEDDWVLVAGSDSVHMHLHPKRVDSDVFDEKTGRKISTVVGVLSPQKDRDTAIRGLSPAVRKECRPGDTGAYPAATDVKSALEALWYAYRGGIPSGARVEPVQSGMCEAAE